jgi:hypothetical protein
VTELPMKHWPTPHQLRSLEAANALAGQLYWPQVRWSKEAAASIAEDETHLRGLIMRHCL